MTTLNDLLATPVMQTLGLTLVHFLWQGTLVALVVAVLLYALRDSSASIRYVIGCTGLAVMMILPIVAFTYLAPNVKPVYSFTDTAQPPLDTNTTSSAQTARATNAEPLEDSSGVAKVQTPHISNSARVTFNLKSFNLYLPWLVALWLVGVLVLSLRLIGGLWLARQLRTRATKPVSEMLESTLRDLASKLNIAKNVRLRESLAVKVPVIIGWLRPVILLPSSAITGLSVKQLELILAHELAHIHRHDYPVNLLQKIAETLLFYHPAVWWLSGAIRQERENCCDDLAIALCNGDKLSYAKTLSMLDSMRPSNEIALAADGGSLLRRIQRLAGKPMSTNYPAQWFVGVLMMLVPWVVLSVATAQAKLPVEIAENIDEFVNRRLEAWGTPGVQVAVIQDGEVTFSKAYGVADVENNIAMTTATPIQVGVGGWFIARVVGWQLVEQGKLSTDDTIVKHLPWVKFKNGEETKITVKQLMDVTANIADPGYATSVLWPNQSATPKQLASEIKSAEDYVRSLMPDNLYTTSIYSASFVDNDILLNLVIEAASGMSFEEYVEQNIFIPLGMNATYDIGKAEENGLATLYEQTNFSKNLKVTTFAPPTAFNAAMSLSMSSQDMVSFLVAILNRDTRLLSEPSWEALVPLSTEGEQNIPEYWRGFFGTLGSTGGSLTVTEFIPKIKTGYIVMTNFNGDFDLPVLEVIGSVGASLALLNDNSQFTPSSYLDRSLPNPSEIAIKNISGKYISALGPVELFAKGDELHGTILGNDFKLESVAFSYLIRSDFEKINGLILKADNQQLMLEDRAFAFRIK